MNDSEQQALSLCDVGEPVINYVFATAQLHQLDDTSWAELIPAFVSGADLLRDRLLTLVPWEQRQRRIYRQVFDEPRMTAEYSNIDDAPDVALRLIASRLSEHYGIRYNGVWLTVTSIETNVTVRAGTATGRHASGSNVSFRC